ncbi:MAG: hypothetical protein COA78_30545 [Blastopirellula sp.]|nr:MAG: hypothetical protein COA78_30545 [Blastopirellula sp.]
MSSKRAKVLIASSIWLFAAVLIAVVCKFWIFPANDADLAAEKEKARQQIIKGTSSDSRYKHNVTFALDGFSGYAPERSQKFHDELARKSIKVALQDDGANYQARLQSLMSGETQMAAFPLDALIVEIRAAQKSGADLSVMPSIVAICDETRGADAMVAYKKSVPSIDALNDSEIKFHLTAHSPSETLTRVVSSHFQLDELGTDPSHAFVEANGAAEVYDRYRKSDPNTKQVFVMWEPYVTKALENPNMHVVVDSSRFKGYIVDAIVCSRDYLAKNPNVVKDVVESHLRALHSYRNTMTKLVLEDAIKTDLTISEKQAEQLVEGVWWKNTLENYSHMGVGSDRSLQHIEDILTNLTDVLLTTGAIDKDPTDDRPNLLYYSKILEDLEASGFHPSSEVIRDDTTVLAKLSDQQWTKLDPLGTLDIDQLVFRRGSSNLESRSYRVLDELAEKLKTWPYAYLEIRGDGSRRGDPAANKQLAKERAESALSYLIDKGVNSNRVRAIGIEPTGTTSVSFVLGQLPY